MIVEWLRVRCAGCTWATKATELPDGYVRVEQFAAGGAKVSDACMTPGEWEDARSKLVSQGWLRTVGA